MIATAAIAKRVWTEADLKGLPEDGYNHEVVDGELVMSPANDFFHGHIATRLSTALNVFVIERRLGVVLDSSTGFWMNNRNCRAPDISFIPKERLRQMGFKPSTREFFPGAPDLAIEILSPNNTRREIDERLQDFFESGTQLAWIIDPEKRRVEVCQSPTRRAFLGSDDVLDGADLLPGFRYPVAELFKEWAWE